MPGLVLSQDRPSSGKALTPCTGPGVRSATPHFAVECGGLERVVSGRDGKNLLKAEGATRDGT
jgi:hypothetical protein